MEKGLEIIGAAIETMDLRASLLSGIDPVRIAALLLSWKEGDSVECPEGFDSKLWNEMTGKYSSVPRLAVAGSLIAIALTDIPEGVMLQEKVASILSGGEWVVPAVPNVPKQN